MNKVRQKVSPNLIEVELMTNPEGAIKSLNEETACSYGLGCKGVCFLKNGNGIFKIYEVILLSILSGLYRL